MEKFEIEICSLDDPKSTSENVIFKPTIYDIKIKNDRKRYCFKRVVKHYLKYTVLIIDEIGYLPVDEAAAFGFFQLIAARYEYRPTILTTNQPFSKWPDVFGDAVIANAIIDRLVHHCDIVKITGHSYRIKGRNIFDNTDD